MAENNESTMTWKVDISQFNKALQEAKKALKSTNDEFALTSSTMDKWSDNIDGLEAKLKQLNGQITAGQRILEIYEKALEDAKKEFGENSREAEIYQEKILKQKTTLNKAETQLKKYTSVLTEMRTEQTESINAYDALNQQITEQEAKVNALRNAYKASIVGNNAEESARLAEELKEATSRLLALKQKMNEADSAAKALENSVTNLGDSTVESISEYKTLSLAIEDQQQKVNALKEEYASAVIQYGKTSTKAQELAKELKGASAELKNMKDKLSDADDEADNLDKSIDNVAESATKAANGGFTVLKGALANLLTQGINKVIDGFKTLAKSAVSYENELESYQISFEVLTGSAEKSAEVISKLATLVKKTPFDMPTLAEATNLLMNYGFTADEAVSKMMMIGDISQGNSDKLHRVALAYGQMNSAGKVLLQDLKQMIEAGFNPLQEISDRTGESMASLYNRISKGTISVDEINQAFVNATSAGGKYYRSMDKQSRSFEGRMSALKETVDSTLGKTFQPLLQKIGDKLLPKVTKQIEEMDTTKLSNGLTDFANKAISAFNWLIKNGEEVVDVFHAIAVAFVTYKAASIIGGVVSAFQGFISAVSTGATVMNALNASFGITPIGLFATGLAAVIALMAAYAKNTKEAMQEEYGLNKEQQHSIDQLTSMIDRYNDLNELRKESLEGINAEYGHIEELKNEYNGLVDSNGKIKEGYEDRANFILTTLAEAMGMELEDVKKLIEENGRLGDSIDKIIQKKKAEAVLSANEQMYTQALKERSTALTKLTEAQKTLEEAEKKASETKEKVNEVWDKYNELVKRSPSEAMAYLRANSSIIQSNQTAQKSYEEAKNKVKEAEEAWVGYNSTIKNYEGLSEAIISGDADKINKALVNMTYNFVTAETGNKESLERQVKNYKTNLEALEKAIQAGTPNVTKDMLEQAKSMVEAAEKELDKLPPEASEKGETAGKNFAKSLGSKKILTLENAKDLTDNAETGITPAIAKLGKAGEKAGKQFAYDLDSEENKNSAKTSGKDLGEEAKAGVDSVKTESSGENFGLGFIGGIAKKLKDAWNKGWELAIEAKRGLQKGQEEGSPSKATRRSGVFFGEGYELGILDMIKPVESAASELAEKAIGALGENIGNQMREIGADGGKSLIDGMATVLPDMNDSIGNLKASVASANASMIDREGFSVGTFGAQTSNSQNIVFNQTINSPKAVDRLTLYRETNSLLFSAKVRLNNV